MRAPGERSLDRNRGADDLAAHLAGRCVQAERLALLQQDQEDARLRHGAPALNDQLEHPIELGIEADRARDRRRGLEAAHGALELGATLLGALVEARVVDRDGGPLRQHHEQPLVAFGEVLTAALVGQVEVAVGLFADDDRRSQEGRHRRVARREAV
jgi:hypothetical protein